MPDRRNSASKSRRRSRPSASEPSAKRQKHEPEEEVLEAGQPEETAKRPKRYRDTAASKEEVKSTEPYRFFEGLLMEMMERDDCEDFLLPVLSLWKEKDVPGYRERIKRPMDLGTVKRNLINMTFVKEINGRFVFDEQSFITDIKLIFENSMQYNEPGSTFHSTAAALLTDINEQVSEREAKIMRQAERHKRESERKKRKAAEEEAALAAATAKQASIALARARQEAEEAERRRIAEFRRREQELQRRMQLEKEAAVAMAVKEALEKQKRDTSQRKMMNTSSVSSDEQEANGEITFAFVSTVGMEKKRGRKSGVVMELEAQHDELMRKRKVMIETNLMLEKEKQVELTYEEKQELCKQVEVLDFVRMKQVVHVIAQGMKRPDIINEAEIEIDVDQISNAVLREIQYFLRNPAATTAREALNQVESQLTDIETQLVSIRYQPSNNG